MKFLNHSSLVSCSLLFLLTLFCPSSATTLKLTALVQEQPLVLNCHNGPLLKGNVTLNLLWYGHFSPTQRSIILGFLHSLHFPKAPAPSVSSWRRTTEYYKGGPSTLSVGQQVFDENGSLGKLHKTPSYNVNGINGRKYLLPAMWNPRTSTCHTLT